MDLESLAVGIGIGTGVPLAIWRVFVYYDKRIRSDLKTIKDENTEAHKGITNRIDRLAEKVDKLQSGVDQIIGWIKGKDG